MEIGLAALDQTDCMCINISSLASADLDAVDGLMKQSSRFVGFLPSAAIEQFLDIRGVIGIRDDSAQLVGYLMHATYSDRIRIVQLCVSEPFRKRGLARKLLEALKGQITTQTTIGITCRNDSPAHNIWPKLGFVPVSEKIGKSKDGHLLTVWRLPVGSDPQLALFRANTSEDILDVAIDAQVFFDFYEPHLDSASPSRALQSDTLQGMLNFWVTDELLVEIGRNPNHEARHLHRLRASSFGNAAHDPLLFEVHANKLERILPHRNKRQQSDINHLAKTAASGLRTFVTRDQGILRHALAIESMINVDVVSPVELILKMRELSEANLNTSQRVAGLRMVWSRLTSDGFNDFPWTQFLQVGENKSRLRQHAESLLAKPGRQLEVLWSNAVPAAIRIIDLSDTNIYHVLLGRVAPHQNKSIHGQFLISESIHESSNRDCPMVVIDMNALPIQYAADLSAMGFVKSGNTLYRFTFNRVMEWREAMSAIDQLNPTTDSVHPAATDDEFERSCSPLALGGSANNFIIPIKPAYAMHLVDRSRSANDLFGGNPEVLLRWENVYYRSPTRAHMLTPPGRIMWYVSSPTKAIVAISHFDGSTIDNAKVLFRKYEKFGTLTWKQLYEMCQGDLTNPLMALKFSHTFSMRKRVELAELRHIFEQDGVGLNLAGPMKVPTNTFHKLYKTGFSPKNDYFE